MSRRHPHDAELFTRPRFGWYLLLDGGIAAMTLLAFDERAHGKVQGVLPIPDQRKLQQLVGGTAAVHVAEATVARRMAKRRGLDRRLVRKWTRQTFIVGFPSLLALRKITAP